MTRQTIKPIRLGGAPLLERLEQHYPLLSEETRVDFAVQIARVSDSRAAPATDADGRPEAED